MQQRSESASHAERWYVHFSAIYSRIVGRKVDLQFKLSTLVWTIVRSGYPACPSMDIVFLRVKKNIADIFFLQVGDFLIDTLERGLNEVTNGKRPAGVSIHNCHRGKVKRRV
jgi:hypothetical protein